MQLQHQKIALDVNDTRVFTVINAHQGDSKTRFIDITLTENGNTITLSSSYVATVKASINNKTKAVNTAVVNTTNNVITVELTKIMLDTPGLLNCEVILQDNQQFVTSATFTVKVAESVISDETEIVKSQEFGKLLDALIEIKDIEDKADRVQTLVDNIDKLESANDIVTRLNNVESKETQLETQHKTDVQALTDKANSIVEQANTDRQNFNKSVDEVNANLDTKENVSNKVSEITYPSLDYYPDTKAVFDYVNSKLEIPLSDIESLKAGKLDKTDFNSYKTSNDNAVNSKVDTTDFNSYKTATDKAVADNTFDLSMLMSSLKRTATGTSIVNLTNTAENGILKVTSNGGVTCKNKNIFEDVLINGINKTRCNVSFDNGIYTVEYTGNETYGFYFGNSVSPGGTYASYVGRKLKYNKNLSLRINCDKFTRGGSYITYFDSNGISLYKKELTTNKAYNLEDVEGADFITLRLGLDYNANYLTTGDIVTMSVQLEYGDTVSDFVVPQSNTDNLSYDGVTNVIGEGEITVEYVENLKSYIDNKFNELATAIVAHESEVM